MRRDISTLADVKALSLSAFLAIWLLSGCAANHYAKTPLGKFYGQTQLEWRSDREFIFHQDLSRPFYFERANGEKIIPKSIFTDGGTIPRPLWSFHGYSPWEYGPAFIIHDWLFAAHQCGAPGYEKYTVDDAAQIMSECIKTLMETQPKIVQKNPTIMYRMNLAVKSFVAKRSWNAGDCPPQPPEVIEEQLEQTQAKLKRQAPRSQRMQMPPKRKRPASEAPLLEKAADSIIQSVPMP